MSRRKKGFKNRKRSGLNRPPVVLGDWTAKKPYKTPTKHDYYYLKLSNEIYQLLIQPKFELKNVFGFERKDIVELSVVIASYIEDFASEIGIWKAFTDYNKEKFGYALPFFDIENEEYFENDFNPQDIAYIAWHYTNAYVVDERIFAPHPFKKLGLAIYNLVEPRIEELSVTGYYDQLFTIKDDHDFFELKELFQWFSFESYLLGVEFGRKLLANQEEVMAYIDEKVKEKKIEEAQYLMQNAQPMLYNFENNYLYHNNCKYGAMNTPIWLSKIVRASEKVKKQLADFYKFKKGYFQFKSIESTHFVFEDVRTGKIFEVNKESFRSSFADDIPIGFYQEMALFYWNDSWNLSGIATSSPQKMKFDLSEPIAVYLYPESTKQRLFETAEDMYNIFVEVHGSPLVICNGKEELDKVYDAYQKQYFEKIVLPKNPELEYNPFNGISHNVKSTEDVAIFIDKIKGITLLNGINELSEIIHQKNHTERDKNVFFNEFYYDPYVEGFTQFMIASNPKIPSLVPNVLRIDLEKYGTYLRYFCSPSNYEHSPSPMNSMVDSNRVELR